MTTLARFTLPIVAALAAAAAWGQSPLPNLPTRSLTAGVHLIAAEVAADERSREVGLMYRPALAPNHGMLFVFDEPMQACMWMRNTLIPLSVAFLDGDGHIVNIEEMDARTENLHCARHAVPYALEMARGWFSERGLKAGQTVIGGLPQQPAQSSRN
jgi:uncharacterized membrane protein (UPF0127 family)